MSFRLITVCVVGLIAFDAYGEQSYSLHNFKKLHLEGRFFSEGASFGDFNGDGKMDIVSGPYWFEGPDFSKKHAYYEPKPFDPARYSDNFFAYTHDMNGDGRTDIVILGFPGVDARWYENPGGDAVGGQWPAHVVFQGVDNESPTFTDLTGDGKPEIVFHYKGRYGYATPDWSDPRKPWTFHPITEKIAGARFQHGLGVGDVNGDGRLDVMSKDGWIEQPESLAGDPMWKVHRYPFTPRGGSQMFAYDFDGDGDNDVISSLAAHAFGLAWFENTGVSPNGDIAFVEHTIMDDKPENNPYGVSFSQLHAMDLIDMDGDGIKDLVTGKRYWAHGGKDPGGADPAVVYWFRTVRTGDGVDFVPYQVDDDSGVGTQVLAGDVNGDGLPDIIVGNKKGTFVHIHSKKKVSETEWRQAQPRRATDRDRASGLSPPEAVAAMASNSAGLQGGVDRRRAGHSPAHRLHHR